MKNYVTKYFFVTLQRKKNNSTLFCTENWHGIFDIFLTFYVVQREMISNNITFFLENRWSISIWILF
jgi:hypothetical protein